MVNKAYQMRRRRSCRRRKEKLLLSVKLGIERVQAFANISRSRYVAIATLPVKRLQIRPIVHN